ncbi:MAG TPA: plastocyanin/azurin family copper-binding protein [Candidatus Thermoplasmatota archaeon]
MSRVFLVAFLFAMSALSGCLGDDEPGESPTNTDGPNGSGSSIMLTVTLLNYTTTANTSEPINITWEVSAGLGGGNSTNVSVEHTDIHFGNETVVDPSNGTYADQTDGLSGPAGEFNATFTVMTNGTFYVRAHATLNGSDFWSDEVVIQVNAGIPPMGTVHEVTIGALPSLPGMFAEYDPSPLTIKAGDGVQWVNEDAVAAHTATSDEGAPQAFDTGNLAAGAESDVIQFTVPGEYTYHCNVHADMSGTLTVEA